MGEIIEFPTRKNIESGVPAAHETEWLRDDGGEEAIDFLSRQTQEVSDLEEPKIVNKDLGASLKFDDIVLAQVLFDYLSSLSGYIKPANIVLHRQGLKEVSGETLLGYLRSSDELKWQQHPTYYRAMLQELHSRGLKVL